MVRGIILGIQLLLELGLAYFLVLLISNIAVFNFGMETIQLVIASLLFIGLLIFTVKKLPYQE
ncbi:MAG: hypothetical protein Q7S92_06835 [Candidatus Diapherotrites archaeon]|nr:hypothetical protein [Candidatus Diapherotrites archaeon]